MNMVENALERVWTRVYDHKIFDGRDGWKFLPGQNFRWVWPQKLRNRLFQILIFCFHEASLGLDLRRYACAMDMVESVLERVWTRVYDHKILDSRDGWKFLSGQNFRWVWPQKLRNRLFKF